MYTKTGAGDRLSASQFSGWQKEPPAPKTKVIQMHQICQQQEVVQVLRICSSDVSIFLEFLPQYKEYLYQFIGHFKTGYLSQHISAWKDINPDQEKLQTVQGIKPEFQVSLFHVVCSEFEIPKNQPLVQKEEDKPLKKGIAVECENEAVEYISPFFLRKKTEEILSIKVWISIWNISTLKCKHFRQF